MVLMVLNIGNGHKKHMMIYTARTQEMGYNIKSKLLEEPEGEICLCVCLRVCLCVLTGEGVKTDTL